MSDDITPRPFHIYRLWDEDWSLLYIGITCQSPPERRFSQHAKSKWWWRSVHAWRIEDLDTYDRAEAEEIERYSIITERPKWNVTHNDDKYLFGVVGHRFVCSFCEWAAHTVQCSESLEWTAMCQPCGEYRDDQGEVYSVLASTIGTSEGLSVMVDHLTAKSWFDFDSLMQFVQCQHLAVAA